MLVNIGPLILLKNNHFANVNVNFLAITIFGKKAGVWKKKAKDNLIGQILKFPPPLLGSQKIIPRKVASGQPSFVEPTTTLNGRFNMSFCTAKAPSTWIFFYKHQHGGIYTDCSYKNIKFTNV